MSEHSDRVELPDAQLSKTALSPDQTAVLSALQEMCPNYPLSEKDWTAEGSSLTRIALNGVGLAGPLPPIIGQLTALEELSLRRNRLCGPIPEEICRMTSLKRLNLCSNELSGPIPPELSDLVNLERLILHSNQLTGTIPKALGELSNLEVLSLSANQLSGKIPPELGQLSNLSELSLSANDLSGAVPKSLGRLKANVDVAHTEVTAWLLPKDLSLIAIDSELGDVIRLAQEEGAGIECPANDIDQVFAIKISMMLGIANVFRPVSTCKSMAVLIFGVALAYWDLLSDVLVLGSFLLDGDYGWFALALLFTLLPLGFSLKFLCKTRQDRIRALLQLNILLEGWKCLQQRVQSLAFVAFKTVETFLEAAPQSFLQLYVLFRKWEDDGSIGDWLLPVSIASSVFTLSVTATSFLHDDDILASVSPGSDARDKRAVKKLVIGNNKATLIRLGIMLYTVSCIGFRLITAALMASHLRAWALPFLFLALGIRAGIFATIKPKLDTQSYYVGFVALLFDSVWEYYPRFLAASVFSVLEGVGFALIWAASDTTLPVTPLLVVIIVLFFIRLALHYPVAECVLFPKKQETAGYDDDLSIEGAPIPNVI